MACDVSRPLGGDSHRRYKRALRCFSLVGDFCLHSSGVMYYHYTVLYCTILYCTVARVEHEAKISPAHWPAASVQQINRNSSLLAAFIFTHNNKHLLECGQSFEEPRSSSPPAGGHCRPSGVARRSTQALRISQNAPTSPHQWTRIDLM